MFTPTAQKKLYIANVRQTDEEIIHALIRHFFI